VSYSANVTAFYYAKIYPQGQHHKELVPTEITQARDKAGEVVGVSGRYIDF